VSIAESLTEDMKSALRAGARVELGALRLALAAIKKQEIENRAPLGDTEATQLLGKLIKQGRDAQQQFEAAGRAELAAKEAAEVAVFERYMPKALSDSELTDLIARTIEATGATSIKEMGRVMAALKTEAAGRVDMGEVSARVKRALSGS
jgi:uncharacterized protein YqeY